MHNHFSTACIEATAFISQSGAGITGTASLLDFVPRTATTLVLHVGINDLAHWQPIYNFKSTGSYSKQSGHHPNVRAVYPTLVLPLDPNRCRGNANRRFVHLFNREASSLNFVLRKYWQRTRGLFLDHGFEWFPTGRMLAAVGFHPSFERVAVTADQFHRRRPRWRSTDAQLHHGARPPTLPPLSARGLSPPPSSCASCSDQGGARPLYKLRHRRHDTVCNDSPN